MMKEGFAASTILTLGCICLCGDSTVGSCTGGGTLAFDEDDISSSSSIFTELINVLNEAFEDPMFFPVCCCVGCGGGEAKGSSSADPEGAKFSPSGPMGSSTDSILVAWGTNRFGARPPRPRPEEVAAFRGGTGDDGGAFSTSL
jgi:hypothetical protein